MTGPNRMFIGFAAADAPVLCLGGEGMRAVVQDTRRLFALLRGAGAPAQLLSTVRVVSYSAHSAVVTVTGERDALVHHFANVARTMGEDLVGSDPLLPAESWIAQAPPASADSEPIEPAPPAYIRTRFPTLRGDNVADLAPDQLARALWAIGRQERTIELLTAACKDSSDPLAHFHLGELLAVQLGRPEAGVPHLERACELAPTVSQPFTSLGIAKSMLGDDAGAVNAFERAAAIDPDDFATWANLAAAYKSADRRDDMRRAATRVQEMKPGEPITAQLLAES